MFAVCQAKLESALLKSMSLQGVPAQIEQTAYEVNYLGSTMILSKRTHICDSLTLG